MCYKVEQDGYAGNFGLGDSCCAVMCVCMYPPWVCLFTMRIEGKLLKHPVGEQAGGPAPHGARGNQSPD